MKIFKDRLILSAIGVTVIFVLAIFYLFANTLSAPLTKRPVTVKVELAQTGGLFEGSGVTYRGVKVGKVTKLVPTDDGVVATARIQAGTEIPANSHVKVRSLSPVGEQYLDFQPEGTDGPYLETDDVIPAESTDLPKSLSSTVVAVNNVLRQIDDKKVKRVLHELATGLAGTGDDLGLILDQGTDLLTTLNQVWPETDRVITNAGPVLGIVSNNADSLRRLGTNAREFARFLAEYAPEFSRVLNRAPKQMQQLEDLVIEAGRVLPDFLSTGVSFTDIFLAYEPHFRKLLQEYAPGLSALRRALHDNQLNVDIIPSMTSRCEYGNNRVDPWTTSRPPFYLDGRCAASFANLRRGAAHTPGPVR